MSFERIISDIKNLRVQGATNVSVRGVKAFSEYAQKIKTKNKRIFLRKAEIARKKLILARPTEPMLQKSLKDAFTIIVEVEDIGEVKKLLEEYSLNFVKKVREDTNKISGYGANLIRNNSRVFTHCHSSTVIKVLVKAKKLGKKFEVVNTETRPLYQGRTTSRELVKAGIKTTQIVDSHCLQHIKKSDAVLLGCDAFTPSYFVNKVGSKMICFIAEEFDVPVYVCTLSSKFFLQSEKGIHPKIEQRDYKEVWKKPPKKLVVENPAFEEVPADHVSLMVTELGALDFFSTVEKVIE